MALHKNANPAFLHLILLANLISKDVGPWKLKWAPKFQNLGAHLAPKIFNKVSPLVHVYNGVGDAFLLWYLILMLH